MGGHPRGPAVEGEAVRGVGGLLAGARAEVRAILGVLPWLRRPFWAFWACLFLPCLLACAAPAGLPAFLLLVGWLELLGACGMIASGLVAKGIRRLRWVRFPEGPEVVPYLPQLVIILLFPPYFASMVVLFRNGGHLEESFLPVSGWPDALLLAVDNFLRTQIFFDAVEIFHLGLWPQPDDFNGQTLLFISRFLMDAAIVKLVVQVAAAAYYRSRGLGRGEDKLLLLKQALAERDPAAVRYLSQAVGDSLREAVDALRAHVETGGPEAGPAWEGLLRMRDFAESYLSDLWRSSGGEERERVGALLDRLRAAGTDPPAAAKRPARRWPAIVLAAGLLAVVAATFAPAPAVGLPVCTAAVAVLAWMLIGSRGWLDRLVTWGVLRPLAPARLPLMIAGWSLLLAPLVVVSGANLFLAAEPLVAGVFAPPADGAVDRAATLAYVAGNLLHTQVFLDVFEVYGIRVARLETAGFPGYLLTFLLSVVFDAGIISLLLSVAAVWYNRLFRRFAVSPNAELELRSEARECGPHAPLLIGHHYRAIRAFLLTAMHRHANDPDLLVPLAASGFLGDWQRAAGTPAGGDADEADRHEELGKSLHAAGKLQEAAAELRQALALAQAATGGTPEEKTIRVADLHVRLGRVLKDLNDLGAAERELRQGINLFEGLASAGRGDARPALAVTRESLAKALYQQRRLAEAEKELRAAIAYFESPMARSDGAAEPEHLALHCRGELANVLCEQGRRAEGIEEYRRYIAAAEDRVRAGRDELRSNLAIARNNLGTVLGEEGRLDEAVAEFREAARWHELLMREGASDGRDHLATCWSNLGGLLRRQGKSAEAIALYRRALELWEQLIREGRTELRAAVGRLRHATAIALLSRGELEQAQAEARWARELFERLVGEGRTEVRWELARCRDLLGDILIRLQKGAEAAAEHGAGAAVLESLLREGHLQVRADLAQCWLKLGVARRQEGQRDEAIRALSRSVGLCRLLVSEGRADLRHPLAQALTSFQYCVLEEGQREKSFAAAREALDLYRRLIAEGRADLEEERASLLRRLEQVVAYFRQAVALDERLVGEGRADRRGPLAVARAHLADVLWVVGRHPEAAAEIRQALAITEALIGEGQAGERPLRVRLLSGLGHLLMEAGRTDEAIPPLRQAVDACAQLAFEGADLRGELAAHRRLLGDGLLRRGLTGEAAAELRQAAELYEQLAGAGNPEARVRLAEVRKQLAQALRAAGDGKAAAAAETAAEIERTRQAIVRLIREIEALSGQDLPPEQYFAGFVDRVGNALGAKASAVWLREGTGRLRLAAGDGLDAVGLADPSRRADHHDFQVRAAFAAGQAVALGPGVESGDVRNFTGQAWAAAPILCSGQAAGLVEVFLGANRSPATLGVMAKFLGQMVALAAQYLSRRPGAGP